MQVVIYDANVLYPSILRDVLIRVGLARIVQPKWTDRILDEVFRNLRTNRPDLDPARLDRTRHLMGQAIRDVTVSGYEHLIGQLDLPDVNDRHVLGAAIHADAQVIVTRNLRDFPADRLTQWGVEAQHPDEFLAGLHTDWPAHGPTWSAQLDRYSDRLGVGRRGQQRRRPRSPRAGRTRHRPSRT